jgi:hypothetical protein
MATSQQTTLGEISVRESRGNHRCDELVGHKENGEPIRCPNSDKICIVHESTGTIEFYCKKHSKDTWVEMALDND